MLYELKKLGIRDGKQYQIDNAYNILMDHDAYGKCKDILRESGVEATNL